MRKRPAMFSALVLAVGMLVAPNAVAQQDDVPSDPGKLPVEAGVAPGVGVPDPRPGEAFADPKVGKLQTASSDVQKELGKLTKSIEKASGELSKATKELRTAQSQRESAEAAVAGVQDQIDEVSRSAYTGFNRPTDLELMMTATDKNNFLQQSSVVGYIREGQDRKMNAALQRHRSAVNAERKALGLEKQADQRKQDLDQRRGDASNRADAISSELSDPINAAHEAVVAQQEQQKKRNEKYAKAWQDYVDRVEGSEVTPPRAGSLRDPKFLPGNLEPIDGANKRPQPGIARADVDGDGMLVLPKETIDAVSAAVDALGKPYVPRDHGDGPESFSCDGLVKRVYSDAGLDQAKAVAEQYATGKPIDRKDIRPGDLVFAGPKKYGVHHVGIALDKRNMIAADGRLASVAVTDIPAGGSLVGVTRPSLGTGEERKVPKRAKDELTWRCGGVELPLNLGLNGSSGSSAGSTSSEGAAGAWGGYPNGLIPSSALCGIGVDSHSLRCDAAQAWVQMSRAFQESSGKGLCITDSYRTFNSQVDLYRRKPDLAAVPGTSNHGWGVAVDLCGGIEQFNTPAYNWMKKNAPRFGWIHPEWAEPGNGREEPWHWEYEGTTAR